MKCSKCGKRFYKRQMSRKAYNDMLFRKNTARLGKTPMQENIRDLIRKCRYCYETDK